MYAWYVRIYLRHAMRSTLVRVFRNILTSYLKMQRDFNSRKIFAAL